jgi:hypothetical protein
MTRKLSAILIDMARVALKEPEAVPAATGANAALVLAAAAWNREVRGDECNPPESYQPILSEFEGMYPDLWDSMTSGDCESLIGEMRAYKRHHHPHDRRLITVCGMNHRGNVEVCSESG